MWLARIHHVGNHLLFSCFIQMHMSWVWRSLAFQSQTSLNPRTRDVNTPRTYSLYCLHASQRGDGIPCWNGVRAKDTEESAFEKLSCNFEGRFGHLVAFRGYSTVYPQTRNFQQGRARSSSFGELSIERNQAGLCKKWLSIEPLKKTKLKKQRQNKKKHPKNTGLSCWFPLAPT